MKKLFFVFFFVLFSLGLNFSEANLYQVITSHPHDVNKISSYINTVHKEGRLWIVDVKKGAPSFVYQYLRSVHGKDLRSYQDNNKLNFAPDREVKEVLVDLDQVRIQKDVETLASFKNRSAGSSENKEAQKWIKKRFLDLGMTVEEPCYRSGICSVVADKVGTTSPEEVIIVVAHFDSVGKSFAGADDNASGTAVMMEMARVLSTYSNKRTLRFFATNGEENGLLGAQHYATQLVANGKIKNIVLNVTMDMVGYNSNGIIELETDSQYESLAQWFSTLAKTYTKLKTKITLGAWGSDHVPFLKAGVSTLLTIEDWNTKTPCYHMECDKPDTLNYQYATEVAKLNTAAVLTKDLDTP